MTTPIVSAPSARATFATTARLSIADGGALADSFVFTAAKLARVGTIAGADPIGGAVCISCVTAMGADWTGRALENAVPVVAVMAPGAIRFRYSTLVTFVVLLTTVMLVTFVTLVTLTWRTYVGLVAYAG